MGGYNSGRWGGRATVEATGCLRLDVNLVMRTVRRALMPLVQLAAETGCTILIIRHLRKQSGKALYRGLGSIGIVGAARVGWLLGPHPRGEGLRVLTATKMNLAEPPLAKVLHTADGVVTWLGEEAWLTPDEITAMAPGQAAARWLELVLARGPKAADEGIGYFRCHRRNVQTSPTAWSLGTYAWRKMRSMERQRSVT